MTALFIFFGILGLVGLSFLGFRMGGKWRIPCIAGGISLFLLFFWVSSYRYIPEGYTGVIVRNALGPSLSDGRVIAANGEMGPQAKVLPPGIHGGYWPFIYEVEDIPVITIKPGEMGIITTSDGVVLPSGVAFAPEWDAETKSQMLDAEYFLGKGKGYKGQQTTVLGPGKYRLNTKLYNVEVKPAISIGVGEVGVVKSNIGEIVSVQSLAKEHIETLVQVGQRGIWREPFGPSVLYMNPYAYEVTTVGTVVHVVEYTAEVEKSGAGAVAHGEKPIEVKTSDGFTFPVDVRVEYYIEPRNSPLVVSLFGDDETGGLLRAKLNSTVRDVFRNVAEKVKALDYVNKRSEQGDLASNLIADEMKSVGVTVTAVRIGDIDSGRTNLGELLKTQMDKEIATQQQVTFSIQRKAAAEEQELNKATQSATEERRLATAAYDVKVNEQSNLRQISQAKADAEKTRIAAQAESDQKILIAKAESESIKLRTTAEAEGVRARQLAEAEGYQRKAEALGGNNLATIEMMHRIAEGQIRITPEIVVGGQGSVFDAIGAMLARNLKNTGEFFPANAKKIQTETETAK